tara:strand:- start:2124 stop:2342 length:219 start_codon:yes stop_codon:yes gene_type:complete
MIQYKFDTYSTYEGVDFQYTIWECDGDFETPAYYAVEIDKIIYKDTDVTDLLFTLADEYVANIREKIEEKEI